MPIIQLKHHRGQCAITIDANLIANGSIVDACCTLSQQFVIIADEQISEMYAIPLQQQLLHKNKDCLLLCFEANESNKTRATKEWLEDQMLAAGLGRDCVLIAVGGGIICDVAGFVGATYCRGIKTVYVPTTLLAMVDAAVGGKTGVNTPYGKNMIGSFYQPYAVYCDVMTLQTLSQDELNNGLVESIKHALLADRDYFFEIERWLNLFIAQQTITRADLINLVQKSCYIKCQTVMADEYEASGMRQLLNFGHTVAHALELEFDYQISHGQAVLIGLWVACCTSCLLGCLSETSFRTIINVLDKFNYSKQYLFSLERVNDIQQHMCLDKKSLNRQARFVLLDDIGEPHIEGKQYSFAVDAEIVARALCYWLKAQQ